MITEPSSHQAAKRIEAWYKILGPRLGVYLTDPNAVLTLADARGQTECYILSPQPEDAQKFKDLNKQSRETGIYFKTEAYTSPRTHQPALMLNIQSLAGYHRVAAGTKLPGIPCLDAAAGWEGIDLWQHEALRGIREAAGRGEYPPEISEDDKDQHVLVGVIKGYPDEAIMAMLLEKPPIDGQPWAQRHTHIPYSDYYDCAQPNYSYDVKDEATIAQHAAKWGKLLHDYYESSSHKHLAADSDFRAARGITRDTNTKGDTPINPVIIFDFNRTLYDPDKRQLMPGAVELLQGAKAKGYTLLLLGKAAASRAQLMDELGIKPYFAEVMLVTEKSDALFEGFAKRHSADKTKSYVVGDRAQGELKYGHRDGWRTIWLRAGKFAHELPAANQHPDHIVGSLDEILALL